MFTLYNVRYCRQVKCYPGWSESFLSTQIVFKGLSSALLLYTGCPKHMKRFESLITFNMVTNALQF